MDPNGLTPMASGPESGEDKHGYLTAAVRGPQSEDKRNGYLYLSCHVGPWVGAPLESSRILVDY